MHQNPIRFTRPLPAYDVLIPCFNRAHVVADAVESVMAQDHAPTRVVVVDDGSRDGSAAVIRRLAGKHAQVDAMILPRNGGASNARNAGAAICTAPWLALLDSDDVWLPGAGATLLRAGDGLDVVVADFARVEGEGEVGEPECGWDGSDIRGALATGGVVGTSWSIVRRALFDAVEGFDPSFHNCNDWDFYTRVAAAGGRFGRVASTVALYRTMAGERLGHDHVAGSRNARRVLAHPFLAAYVRSIC
jgi:glycosyltransferase involved in cell wall biosynthesis